MEGETSFFYGDTTKEAVLAYQTAAGMEPDGILTMDEQNVIFSDDAIPAPKAEEPEETEEPAEEDAAASDEEGKAAVAAAAADDGENIAARSASSDDPAEEAAAKVVGSVSSAAEVTNGIFVQTVNAATKDQQAAQTDDIGNGVIAFAVVLFGALLTTTLFIVRKRRITIRDFAVALIRKFF